MSSRPNEREISFDDPRTTLWVKAPEFQGYLLKKGFRWTRQWKKRWVVLQNREITYYDRKPPDDELSRQLVEPRGSATLQRDLQVSPKSMVHTLKDRPLDFVLYPGGNALPWELRAETQKDREAWLQVFNHCVHVASWLQTFQMGGLLGVGAAAVVREVRVRDTGEKFALKIVTIHDPRMRYIEVLFVYRILYPLLLFSFFLFFCTVVCYFSKCVHIYITGKLLCKKYKFCSELLKPFVIEILSQLKRCRFCLYIANTHIL
jgi:hypothetical protein